MSSMMGNVGEGVDFFLFRVWTLLHQYNTLAELSDDYVLFLLIQVFQVLAMILTKWLAIVIFFSYTAA